MKTGLVLFNFLFLISFLNAQSNLSYKLNFNEETGVKTYEKAEIGVHLPKEVKNEVDKFLKDETKGLNPFDPEQVDLSSVWTAPNGETQKVNGFYYQAFRAKNDKEWEEMSNYRYNWLLRWSPDQTGEWKVIITLKTKTKSWEAKEFKIKCSKGTNDGVLTHDPSLPNGDKFFYQSEKNTPFIAAGHNLASGGLSKIDPTHGENIKVWLKELNSGDANFWRLELGLNNYLPTSTDGKNYKDQLAPFCELDQIMELSSKLGMYFIAFRHHIEVQNRPDWASSSWTKNGLVSALDIKSRIEYFTSPEVIKWQKNELRYMMARWGYTQTFSFYGYSEIEGWIGDLTKQEDISEIEAMKIFTGWFKDQKSYIQNELDMKRMMFANTFSVGRVPDEMRKKPANVRAEYDIFMHSDMVGYHSYGIGKDNNLETRANYAKFFQKHWNKPTILEEAGYTLPHLYCATDQNFFNTIWSSSFQGDFGTGMHYWWDRGIHYNNMQMLYKPLVNFTSRIDYTKDFTTSTSFNGSVKSSRLAQYSISMSEGNVIYGFLTDPSYNWRNMKSSNEKIRQLIDDGKMKEICLMKDGHRLGEPLSNEKLNNDDPRYKDAYTDEADKSPMTAESYERTTIKVKGLKKVGFFKKKNKVIIQYYNPRDPDLKILKTETKTYKKNGSIKLTMDSSNWPACAFTIKTK